MTYQQRIATITPDADPASVEAWMRADYGTLDVLTDVQFRAAARNSAQYALEHPDLTVELRRTFGL